MKNEEFAAANLFCGNIFFIFFIKNISMAELAQKQVCLSLFF